MGFLARLLKRSRANQPNLSRALRAVVEADTSATRSNLRDILQNQRLILPIPKTPGTLERDDVGRLQRDMKLDFISFQDRDGRKFMALFANPDNLKKWKPDIPAWIAVDTPSLCRLALKTGQSAVRINPREGEPR